jgi:hypothetical protein
MLWMIKTVLSRFISSQLCWYTWNSLSTQKMPYPWKQSVSFKKVSIKRFSKCTHAAATKELYTDRRVICGNMWKSPTHTRLPKQPQKFHSQTSACSVAHLGPPMPIFCWAVQQRNVSKHSYTRDYIPDTHCGKKRKRLTYIKKWCTSQYVY